MITVILATWNGARSLERTLESFGRLERPDVPWRLIVVDNGSTDATPRLIEAYAGALPMTIVREPQSGKSRAVNRALELVGAGLVVFVDDDMVLDADWLRQYESVATRQPDHALFAGESSRCGRPSRRRGCAIGPTWTLATAFTSSGPRPLSAIPALWRQHGNSGRGDRRQPVRRKLWAFRCSDVRHGRRNRVHSPARRCGPEILVLPGRRRPALDPGRAHGAELAPQSGSEFRQGPVSGRRRSAVSVARRWRTQVSLRMATTVARWREFVARRRGDEVGAFRAQWRQSYLAGFGAELRVVGDGSVPSGAHAGHTAAERSGYGPARDTALPPGLEPETERPA